MQPNHRGSLDRRRSLRRTLLSPVLALLWLVLTARAAPADSAWLDANGRPNVSARDALRLLADAGGDGLAPRDYRAAELAQQAATLDAIPGELASPWPAFERELDAAMHRYFHDGRAHRRLRATAQRDQAGQPVKDGKMLRRCIPTGESAGDGCTERKRFVP